MNMKLWKKKPSAETALKLPWKCRKKRATLRVVQLVSNHNAVQLKLHDQYAEHRWLGPYGCMELDKSDG